ncbi:aminodeoxychorismate/anthranilate synthase component II [Oscillospiraceae bacterium CM]|nr:aminodeoxychorismate/anthranilate synthase component II [Oscillospiraceae bacterium CM]
MFLMIDNYDSFTYNLVRYLEELDEEVHVARNDKITLSEIDRLQPLGIIISPGPKTPKEAGLSLDIIRTFKGRIPILGICLGHQAIGYAFGARVVRADKPMHGKISVVEHDGAGVYVGIKNPLSVTRYHSLIVDRETVPDCLKVTCRTHDGVIMGLRHLDYLIEGIQFHPEAELTECGHAIIKNFIELCRVKP